MSNAARVLTPIVPEFATQEETESYERWLRAKIEPRLAEGRPLIPHEQVMARTRAIIAEYEQAAKQG